MKAVAMNEVITKNDTIHSIVSRHPELKEVLKSVSPKFSRLDNPVMFNTVARVATVEQAAKTGGVYLRELLYRLNEEIGLGPEYLAAEKASIAEDLKTGKGLGKVFETLGGKKAEEPIPAWIEEAVSYPRLDARNGEEPFAKANKLADGLDSGKGFILLQTFEPVPLIRHISGKGFDHYVYRKGPTEYWVYFRKR